ncbi:MAG: DUF2085 domain-containing protein [Candidatus Thorarchaeota archaeon]|nr:DUF2085 domain-containing protein [Candidatus Thorarchaeota archaeon]
MHPDEYDLEAVSWGRFDATKEAVHMMISHHPPSMFGHCLRVSFRGKSLYLCGRCSGIYGGMGLGLIVLIFTRPILQPDWLWFVTALGFGFSTVIDWMSQRLTPRKTTNMIRAATGFLSGLSLAIIFYLGNLIYMLVAMAVMLVAVGGVGLVENRRFKRSIVEFTPEDTFVGEPEDMG